MNLNTNSPYTYKEWAVRQNIDVTDASHPDYLAYLKSWYENKKNASSVNTNNLKSEYIQLLKDLSFLFGKSEQNRFLQNIDYTNDEEIIYAIPFFAKKLKEISIVLKGKRNAAKNAKIKYNMIGSNKGLETLLYDYVLRSFTKKEGNITQVPASELQNILPALSSVKNDFYVEIEELHDPNVYYDSDPNISIYSYEDISKLVGELPLETLSEAELSAIESSRFLPRIANSTLSKLVLDYATYDTDNGTSVTSSLIDASKKYMGETVYGLTAVRLVEINKPDLQLSMNLYTGNNWFLWPSGNVITNDYTFSNIFSPIEINNSSLLDSGATAGTSYTEADLIFTDKNGSVEGAWLLGTNVYTASGTMAFTVLGGEDKDVRFPYVGFKLAAKGYGWDGFSITDDLYGKFETLPNLNREDILKKYYTENFPNSSVIPFQINYSHLVECGATAGQTYFDGDTIFKQPSSIGISQSYNEAYNGSSEAAYLYQPIKTDLPIAKGINYLYWPFVPYTTTTSLPLTIKNDACLPIKLNEVDVATMVGSIAGTSFNTGDVIFKLNSRTEEPLEAAFLRASTTDELDIYDDTINIYQTSALRCSKYIAGPVQSSLSIKIDPIDAVSFIWCDKDTYADDVFKFFPHSEDCPYGLKTHDYYTNQTHSNFHDTTNNTWKSCTCKSVNFSPIGNNGNNPFSYNGVADMLFHDPDGVGVDFTLNGWTDTRNLSVLASPQFSFYKLTSGDSNIGWGEGYWKTGSGDKMILKCGKRYTYYRTSLRKDSNADSTTPYLVVKYPYKSITGICGALQEIDICIVWDISKTETGMLETSKDIIKKLYRKLIEQGGSNVKVSVISFGSNATLIGYLTSDANSLDIFINDIRVPTTYPDFTTNISAGLKLAYKVLTTRIPDNNGKTNNDFLMLCKSLQAAIIDGGSAARTQNAPRDNALKKILLFSDGKDYYDDENGVLQTGGESAIAEATFIKNKGIEINSYDVGVFADYNNLMEIVATDPVKNYFNLQKYLVSGDGDVHSFIEYTSRKINGCVPIIPRWTKAIRDSSGTWVGTSEDTDMILNPGDYLGYLHRDEISYIGEDGYSDFITNAINFTINVKLDGWDYANNMFSLSATGLYGGGKPFWGKAYTNIDDANGFSKQTSIFGGNIRFFEDYTPVSQPEVSDMVLTNDCILRYKRRSITPLTWREPLQFNVEETVNKWKKLDFYTGISNLDELLAAGNIDKKFFPTYEDSQILLEGYSQFKPALYNYFARNNFTYNENLYFSNRDINGFVTFLTGKYIEPVYPYENLLNVHYPTIAIESFPLNCITEKSIGYYMLPEKLGMSTYLGRGYTSTISNDQIFKIDSLSAERLYFDTNKYGNRNRGLTKNDQYTITEITDVDSRWIYDDYYSGERSGTIKNPQKIQKMLPYQTDFEQKGVNYYGLSRQEDDLELWYPVDPATWKDSGYKLSLRGEVSKKDIQDKIATFLINSGILTTWKTDMYGNDFGVYK